MTDLSTTSFDERCVIVIATRSPSDCLEAIAHALPRVGGRMRGLSLKPVGAQFEATLRLSNLGETGADRAASLIAAWPNAGSVKVEHQWVRA
jgi:hypothetical protein